jgi:hypothetical protein
MKNITQLYRPANDNFPQSPYITSMESLKSFLLKEQEKQGFVFAEDVYGRELENIFNNQQGE